MKNHWRMPTSSPRHANDPDLLALGTAIRRIRLEQDISQEELAHRSEIDRAYMSSIERGQQNPGIVSILRIAKALELTAAELMAAADL
jgi:transcriptional regulator with XRE-family HTH domain